MTVVKAAFGTLRAHISAEDKRYRLIDKLQKRQEWTLLMQHRSDRAASHRSFRSQVDGGHLRDIWTYHSKDEAACIVSD